MADGRLHPAEKIRIIREDTDVYPTEQLGFGPGFCNSIVVHNLPVVPKEKLQKLEGVIRKIFCQFGTIKDLVMGVDSATQETSGCCLVRYNAPQEAKLAKERTNGYKLDRKHAFSVSMFDEHTEAPELSVSREIPPCVPGENLQQWLTDEKARDQFVIRADSDTEVFWNDAKQLKPDPVYKHAYWTESFVQWSPLGTYLATVHRQGVAVWGGASSFNRLMRYDHPQVKLIDFSPGEKYLVTYSRDELSNCHDANTSVVNIFDVKTGKVMRDFKGSVDKFSIGGTGGTGVCMPTIRWSGGKEDKYFATMGKDMISVYETETFSLVDEKSLKVENVVDFSWSPTDPILALFIPEQAGVNQPATVSLVKIPSKEEVRKQSLFGVSDCKMYWQSNGDYLALKVDRYTKSKRTTNPEVGLLWIKGGDIPIEVLELENKEDRIIAFAWEPKGHRFAVIHGDSDVSFYSMRTAHDTGRVSKLTTLKGKKANALFWSPGGRYIILAGLEGFEGRLEFFYVDELVTMGKSGHYEATGVEWDPTGRYVATSAQHGTENGFIVWSFHGKQLYQIRKDCFLQFMWRPRPPCSLSPEVEGEIENYLKKYSKRYKAKHLDVSVSLSEQDREKRRMKDEWGTWVDAWKRRLEEEELGWIDHFMEDEEASDEEEEEEEEPGRTDLREDGEASHGKEAEEEESGRMDLREDGEASHEEEEEEEEPGRMDLWDDGEASHEEEEEVILSVSEVVLSSGFGRGYHSCK